MENIALKIKEGKEEDLRDELRLNICRNYWYLAGELFRIEGLLGWSPGYTHRRCRVNNRQWGFKQLEDLMENVSKIPKDPSIDRLIQMAEERDSGAVEIKFFNFFRRLSDYIGGGSVISLYDHIAENCTEYELGAARPFLYISDIDSKLACAGFIMIITRGISRKQARKTFAKQKAMNTLLNFEKGNKK